MFVKSGNIGIKKNGKKIGNVSVAVYFFLFILILLSLFRGLSVFVIFLPIFYAIFFDRKALKVDYALLFTFVFFFGLADNLRQIIRAEEAFLSEHVFLFSAMASQIISNVPTALLFAKFTRNWNDLLWGVNAGGFGSLFGSLANLIAYKFYVTYEKGEHVSFTVKFLISGYAAFIVSIIIFSLWFG